MLLLGGEDSRPALAWCFIRPSRPIWLVLMMTLLTCLCVASRASSVLMWGHSGYYNSNVPAEATNAVKLGGGFFHTIALSSTGSLVTWGSVSAQGVATMPAPVSGVVDIAAGILHTLALTGDGRVAAWGSYVGTNMPAGLSNIVLIAAGGYHNVAAKSDGTLIAWGNSVGPTPSLDGVVALACGGAHNLALRYDGLVLAWGDNYWGQTNIPVGLTNVRAIACGGNHSLALTAEGRVVAWGNNSRGQTNVPVGLSNVVQIAGGNEFSTALKADGTVTSWGDYVGTNLPAGLTNLDSIVAGGYYTAALSNVGPLRIIQQPRDVLVVAGDTPIFRCAFVGRPRARAQWFHDGNAIPQGTNEVMALPVATPADVGNYWCVVSNGAATIQSVNAALGVLPLALTVQPTNVAVHGGDPVVFEAQARNIGPFQYQWQHNGTNLANGTNSLLILSNAFAAHAGEYLATVSNAFGSVTTTGAMLSVTPISILVQPTNRTIYSGESTTFRTTAWKNGPFTYQWRYNGADLVGEMNASLTVSNASTNHSGDYSVLVSNPYGSILTSNANLMVVATPPLLTRTLSNQFVWHLGSVTLRVEATGSKPLMYQWRFGNENIVDATNSILTRSNLTPELSGDYSVVVSNSIGVVSSTGAVTVIPLAYWGWNQTSIRIAPPITNVVALGSRGLHALALHTNGTLQFWGNAECWPALPAGLTGVVDFAVGDHHDLALRSNGSVTAWGCNGNGQTNVPGGLNGVVALAAGNKHSLALRADGTVRVWGGLGSPAGLRSVVAITGGDGFSLALKADGTISGWGSNLYGAATPPAGLSNVVQIATGDLHSLALKADGTVVAWGKNSEGQTNVPAGLSNVVAVSAGGYESAALLCNGKVVAWGTLDFQTNLPPGLSNVVAIATGQAHGIAQVDALPLAWVRQPLAATVSHGRPLLMSGAARSAQLVYYQWQKNGNAIEDATNSQLRMDSVQVADEALYSLLASNAFGSITSRTAAIVITDRPPVVVSHPLSAVTTSLAPVVLSAVAMGSPILNYQWYKDGAAVAAGTNATLMLASPQRSNGGYYSVMVSNAFGSVTSAEAKIRVVVPLRIALPEVAAGEVRIAAADKDGAMFVSKDLPFFSVWTSSNLEDWELLPNSLSVSNGQLWLRDTTGPAPAMRFYRFGEKLAWRSPTPQQMVGLRFQVDGAVLVGFGESNGERLTLADLPNLQVLTSSNLVSWQPILATVSLTNGTAWLRDHSASNSPLRFYRVIEVP